MSFTAIVENDTIKLPPGVHLPDGTEVSIEPRGKADAAELPRTTLAERLAPFIGCINTGLSDLAENHDHYLYGTPKRGK
jgi:hypothetical protein